MASGPRAAAGGTSRVLEKLRSSVENGQYYEAHQMYRTLYFRYLGKEKYDELVSLLAEGAALFLAKDQGPLPVKANVQQESIMTELVSLANAPSKNPTSCFQTSGADLGILLIDVLKKANKPVDDPIVELLAELFAKMKPELPERQTFLSNALSWSGTNEATNTTGHPDLHRAFAKTLWHEKNYNQARHHFLRSNDGNSLGKLLVEQHLDRAKPDELDFFITQPVLQALCLRNTTLASDCFRKFVTEHPNVQRSGSVFRLPLLNFTFMLLESVNTRQRPAFETLIQQYKPALDKDPSYASYLERIGNLYFEIAARRQPPGILGMLQSILGEPSEVRPQLSARSEPQPTPTLQADDLD